MLAPRRLPVAVRSTCAFHLALAGLLLMAGCSPPSAAATTQPSDLSPLNSSRIRAEIAQQMNTCMLAQQNFMSGQLQRENASFDYIPQAYQPPSGCTNADLAQLTTRAWQVDIAQARAAGDKRSACVIEPIQGCDPGMEHYEDADDAD
jgi:hypothetical protein